MEMQTEKNELSNEMKYGIARQYILLNRQAVKISGALSERGILTVLQRFRSGIAEIVSLASFNPKFARAVKKPYSIYRHRNSGRNCSIEETLDLWDTISYLLRENKIIAISDEE